MPLLNRDNVITIGKPGTQGAIRIEIADAVSFVCSFPLHARELALEELTSAANGAKRIPLDHEDRRIPAILIAPAGPGLVL
jgi:hypothetical protein